MTDLSPAAWAAQDAYARTTGIYDDLLSYERRGLAAALRALADHQQAPGTLGQPIDHWSPDNRTRRELRNLAAELEGADGQ